MSFRRVLTGPKIQAGGAGSLSGLLAFLSFPPADLGILAFVALVPLALFFRRAAGRDFAIASFAFGLAFFGPLIWWIRLFGSIAWVGLVLAQTLWMVAALAAGHFLASGRLKWRAPVIIVFPAAFLAGEYLRSHLPLGGFGWGGLGYSQHDNPFLLKLAPFTGVWGISLLVAVTNSFLAEAWTGLRTRIAKSGALIAGALALALAPGSLPAERPEGNRIKVAMVQGNVPENTFDPRSDDLRVFENHLALTRTIAPSEVDLVVWPEGAFDTDPFAEKSYRERLAGAVRETGAPFLVGAILPSEAGKGKIRNSTLFVNPDGRLSEIYSKQHPVPFGEYVPFRKFLAPLVQELQRVPRDQVPGTESTVFRVPQGRLASVICYESTYPGLVRSFVENGARLLVVSTNDSSFERTPASEQHVAFSQLRAAEHRMWVAHTAVSGISAVVRPDGTIAERSDLFEPELFIPRMRFATETTFYARAGDWLPAAVLSALGLALAVQLIDRYRHARPAEVLRKTHGPAHSPDPVYVRDGEPQPAGRPLDG